MCGNGYQSCSLPRTESPPAYPVSGAPQPSAPFSKRVPVNCPQPVLLSIEEYEAIRAEPTHFVVAPSSEHVNPEIERVVKREERYWVLEKVGVGAAVAEAFDPRSP